MGSGISGGNTLSQRLAVHESRRHRAAFALVRIIKYCGMSHAAARFFPFTSGRKYAKVKKVPAWWEFSIDTV